MLCRHTHLSPKREERYTNLFTCKSSKFTQPYVSSGTCVSFTCRSCKWMQTYPFVPEGGERHRSGYFISNSCRSMSTYVFFQKVGFICSVHVQILWIDNVHPLFLNWGKVLYLFATCWSGKLMETYPFLLETWKLGTFVYFIYKSKLSPRLNRQTHPWTAKRTAGPPNAPLDRQTHHWTAKRTAGPPNAPEKAKSKLSPIKSNWT